MNHPFVDGNKRAGHAAMETFLVLNRLEINAVVDEQERVILALAAGELDSPNADAIARANALLPRTGCLYQLVTAKC